MLNSREGMRYRAKCIGWTAAAVAAFLTASASAYAQGCAMCYNNAAAAKAAGIQALRSGTLILLFPVLLMFVGILAMAFRSRNRFNESESAWELGAAGAGEEPQALYESQNYRRLPLIETEPTAADWDSNRSRP